MASGERNDEEPTARWLGIDFSGNHSKWKRGCRNSNVWIATVERHQQLVLISLMVVQSLPGDGIPFERLAFLLQSGDYDGAAIDAPFSIPIQFVSACGGYAAMLRQVAALPCNGRPFADGAAFVHCVSGQTPPLTPPKPLRKTERFWIAYGVNVRSTLWVKPRGGAPMTAACLSLLNLAQRPIWPWNSQGRALLVEAFPAAQLKSWQWPHQGYNGNTEAARQRRRGIVHALAKRIQLGAWRGRLIDNADALDATLAAFAAVAVTDRRLAAPVARGIGDEGWIAVHA